MLLCDDIVPRLSKYLCPVWVDANQKPVNSGFSAANEFNSLVVGNKLNTSQIQDLGKTDPQTFI